MLGSLGEAIRSARRRSRYLGTRAALATVLTESSPATTRRVQQLIGHPTLGELQRGGTLTTSPEDVLRALGPWEASTWPAIQAEYEVLDRRLAEVKARRSRAYPATYEVERSTSLLLYALTRIHRPRQVVETGVADGTSSYFFLAALRANGEGTLHSLDIADDVGGLVEDRGGWDLQISPPAEVEATLHGLLRTAAPVDLFFHDADHRHLPQMLEYELLQRSITRPALLVSDDVDLSYAFDMFAKRHRVHPHYLLDRRKVVGAVRLQPEPAAPSP